MTATYDPTQLTALDRIRFILGDTDVTTNNATGESNAIKPDEEYLAVIARTASEDEATAVMAEALAAQVSQDPTAIGQEGESYTWGERIRTWLTLADQIRARIALTAKAARGTSRSVRSSRGGREGAAEYGRSWNDGWN